jgi:hypothetical protein
MNGRNGARHVHASPSFSFAARQPQHRCLSRLNRRANLETITAKVGGAAKTDASTPPADANTIQAVTASDVFSWPGPDVGVTWQSERTGLENKWFALTGRVVAVQVAADGDLHIALGDALDKPGIVVCEVPAGSTWCEIRKTVFSWTRTRLPLHIRSTRELTINETPIITVIRQGILGCRARAKRSIKPPKEAAPVCGLGNSSRDGAARRSVVAPTLKLFGLTSWTGFS